jgi:hypothetical protein
MFLSPAKGEFRSRNDWAKENTIARGMSIVDIADRDDQHAWQFIPSEPAQMKFGITDAPNGLMVGCDGIRL